MLEEMAELELLVEGKFMTVEMMQAAGFSEYPSSNSRGPQELMTLMLFWDNDYCPDQSLDSDWVGDSLE